MFCYALSPNDGTEWRLRIQSEAEHFIDVSSLTSDVIARMINEDQIQILINLNGYTKVRYRFLILLILMGSFSYSVADIHLFVNATW